MTQNPKPNSRAGLNEWIGDTKKLIAQLDKQYRSDINHMANLFTRKQRAMELRNTRTVNTGTLDMTKIHQYKYNDDIFSTWESKPDGMHHGMLIMVDGSGSMHGENIVGTMIQLRTLVQFARKTKIPYRVVMFKSKHNGYSRQAQFNELLSSEMTDKQNNLMFEMMFMANNPWKQRLPYKKRQKLGLDFFCANSGTPLSESLILLRQYAHKFIEDETIQPDKLTTVIITDGDGCGNELFDGDPHEILSNEERHRCHELTQPRRDNDDCNGTIIDPLIGKTTRVKGGVSYIDMTRYYKKSVPGKLVGYFIGSRGRVGRGLSRAYRGLNNEETRKVRLMADDMPMLRREIDSKTVTDWIGYDTFSIVASDSLSLQMESKKRQSDFNPNIDAYMTNEKVDTKSRKKFLLDFVETLA